MRLKAKDEYELTNIITKYLTIELAVQITLMDEDDDPLMRFVSNKLENNLYNSTVVAPNLIDHIIVDHEELVYSDIYDQVFKHINKIDNIQDIEIEVIIEGNFNKDYYMDKLNNLVETTPIKIKTLRSLMNFTDCILKDKIIDQTIISFRVNIPDLDYVLCLDMIIDKVYTFGFGAAIVSIVRPDLGESIKETDVYYIGGKKAVEETKKQLKKDYINIFKRCMACSSEDIEIYAYTNCEVIPKNKGE